MRERKPQYPQDRQRRRCGRRLTAAEIVEREGRELDRIARTKPDHWTYSDLSRVLRIRLDARRRGDRRRAAQADRLSDRIATTLYNRLTTTQD